MVLFIKSSAKKQETEQNLSQLIETAMQRGVLSRKEHLQLTSAMLSDQTLTANERHRINQVFDLIRMGRVQLAD